VKMTFEMEINEALMDLLRENMKNLPQMMQMWQRRREETTKSA